MRYVDLFAGCGGLSLGIERAGAELVLAVEKSDMAARTFYHNVLGGQADELTWRRYLSSSAKDQMRSRLLVKELGLLLEDGEAVSSIAAQRLDAVVGGPPCQGFSLAGRRKPNDARNILPWQFLQFVDAASPRFVVIENVVGMDRSFVKGEASSFKQLQQALERTGKGYAVQGVLVNALHYGAPQHRPRLMILGARLDVAEAMKLTVTDQTWRSDFLDRLDEEPPSLAPIPTMDSTDERTVADAVGDLLGKPVTGYAKGNKDYLDALNDGRAPAGPLANHVLRKHNNRTTTRFRLYQYLSANGLDPRILGRAAGIPADDARLLLKLELAKGRFPATSPDGQVLAREVNELVDLGMTLLTKKHSQKILPWKAPARTVVTLPDDYVHPIEPRIFTVRELARFQGFPDDFEFVGKETTGSALRRFEVPQYSQVGNAVSPWLSRAVGDKICSLIPGWGSQSEAVELARPA